MLGTTLQVEVAYSSPSEEKEMVIAVRNLEALLQKVPKGKLEGALVNHFSKHTSHKAAECRIIERVGYLSFHEQAGYLTFIHFCVSY